MMLLTPVLRFALRANDICRHAALRDGKLKPDPAPVVKLLNPIGAATWLPIELADDNDTLFGLADVGFGTPELGSFSLAELADIRLRYGLGIERDTGFDSDFPLSVWAAWSRRAGSILWAETLLRRAVQSATDPEIQPPGQPGDG